MSRPTGSGVLAAPGRHPAQRHPSSADGRRGTLSFLCPCSSRSCCSRCLSPAGGPALPGPGRGQAEQSPGGPAPRGQCGAGRQGHDVAVVALSSPAPALAAFQAGVLRVASALSPLSPGLWPPATGVAQRWAEGSRLWQPATDTAQATRRCAPDAASFGLGAGEASGERGPEHGPAQGRSPSSGPTGVATATPSPLRVSLPHEQLGPLADYTCRWSE